MEIPDGVLPPAEVARLATIQEQRRTVAELDVGVWGVLDVVVDHLSPPRTFRRKNGSEGTIQRVTLSDATGTIDLVLWDGEGELTKTDLAPGRHVRIRGPTVKAGWKGGLELGLGSAIIEAAPEVGPAILAGAITAISDTDIIDGRFRADVTLDTATGPCTIVVWDDAVKAARDAGIGGDFSIQATPHPALDGWYLA